MKRLFCLLAVALLLTACASSAVSTAASSTSSSVPESTSQAAEAAAVTFTDDLGREVTVSSPKRVAILLGSYADVWSLAGGKDTIVAAADDSWRDFDLELDNSVANLGSLLEPSMETLISAEPDFVIASSNTKADLELQDSLEELGIPVAYFGVNTFDEYLHMLDICTQITGQRSNYQTYGLDVQAQVDAAKAEADGSAPTVLFLRAGSNGVKVKNSKDTVLGAMLADLGAVNIADSDTALLEDLSLEQIMADDPQFIFAVYQGSDQEAAQKVMEQTLTASPAWNSLTAVQEGRYYVMDKTLYHLKPNDRWGEAYQRLADILYGGN